MQMSKLLAIAAVAVGIFLSIGCELPHTSQRSLPLEPLSRGYQPIDPEPVVLANMPHDSTQVDLNMRLRPLLSNTVTRTAIGRVDTSGSINFGPLDAGRAGESYVVVVDRILYTATSVPIEYQLADVDITDDIARHIKFPKKKKEDKSKDQDIEFSTSSLISVVPTKLSLQGMHDDHAGEYLGIYANLGNDRLALYASFAQSEIDLSYITDSIGNAAVSGYIERLRERLGGDAPEAMGGKARDARRFHVPVYLGVGVRMRFEITVIAGDVDLAVFSDFGAKASRGEMRGTVTLQTLGITGQEISDRLPVPIEVSEASIPIVLQSLTSIFRQLHDDDAVNIHPQLVGFESPSVLHGGASFLESVVRSRVYSVDVGDDEGRTVVVSPKSGSSVLAADNPEDI